MMFYKLSYGNKEALGSVPDICCHLLWIVYLQYIRFRQCNGIPFTYREMIFLLKPVTKESLFYKGAFRLIF